MDRLSPIHRLLPALFDRLEQWARLTVGGMHNMFLFQGEELELIVDNEQWYRDSIQVLQALLCQHCAHLTATHCVMLSANTMRAG